ncbi:MAG: polysulfide reductase NrfD [Gemmatimonadetes bacterium]|jgi:protein NrfD|nr:polysulfide reductase NrfD [Gemmatimonadota bacterium]MBT6144864.1 polysulfide reductase NrfD [Gemmatimonadota bacterium]MBT7861143.1 polysulfide reductase NrfD [Gemmatimonadota bacterium]
MEVELTRYSHLVDPQLHVWGWEIPVYLFLGGVAAGMMIVAGALARRGDDGSAPTAVQFALMVPVLLSIGMLALFFDLEYKAHVYRFYLAFMPTSPMSWGSWILLAVYPASALLGLAGAAPHSVQRWARWPLSGGEDGWLCRLHTWGMAHLPLMGNLNIALGVSLGIYTGVLLGTLGAARPMWNSALLGPLFLLSGASTGMAAMMLAPIGADIHHKLRRWDLGAIGAELILLGLFLIGLLVGGGTDGRASAQLLLGGAYTAPFFAIVVVAGLLVPFCMAWVEGARQLAPTRVAPLLVLAGGLGLRWILVMAGQA